ncbi:MAG: DUF1587 domain-containing protein, partial [Opitutaceae bacterium]
MRLLGEVGLGAVRVAARHPRGRAQGEPSLGFDNVTLGTLSPALLDRQLDAARPEVAAERWEAVVRKLHHRQMPPPGEARPSEDAYREAVAELTGSLDRAAAAAPDPGRTDTLRRLNRTEYENAVRDLLALEIDA